MINTAKKAFNRFSVFRHSIVGAVCAVMSLIIQSGSVMFLGLHYIVANILSFVIVIPLSYMLHQTITFRLDDYPSMRRFYRYAMQWVLLFIINLVLMIWFVDGIGLSNPVAVILVTAVLYSFSYIVQRWWVFKPSTAP